MAELRYGWSEKGDQLECLHSHTRTKSNLPLLRDVETHLTLNSADHLLRIFLCIRLLAIH